MNKSHFSRFPWGWQKVQSCCDAPQAGWKEQDGALHPSASAPARLRQGCATPTEMHTCIASPKHLWSSAGCFQACTKPFFTKKKRHEKEKVSRSPRARAVAYQIFLFCAAVLEESHNFRYGKTEAQVWERVEQWSLRWHYTEFFCSATFLELNYL